MPYRYLPILFACAALGCQSAQRQDMMGPFPTAYRQIARDHLKSTLFDPYTVRDAMIAEPKISGPLIYRGWLICVRANAKNRFGGYTGLQATGIMVRQGSVIRSFKDAGMWCGDATYQPFPELTS